MKQKEDAILKEIPLQWIHLSYFEGQDNKDGFIHVFI